MAVVAAQKYEGLEGVKLLVVQPLDEDRRPNGRPQVAADATHVGGWSACACCRCLSPGLGRDVESACRLYRPRDPRKTALWGPQPAMK